MSAEVVSPADEVGRLLPETDQAYGHGQSLEERQARGLENTSVVTETCKSLAKDSTETEPSVEIPAKIQIIRQHLRSCWKPAKPCVYIMGMRFTPYGSAKKTFGSILTEFHRC